MRELRKILVCRRGFSLKLLIFLMVLIIAVKFSWKNFIDETVYRGKGFSIKGPAGWQKIIDKKNHTVTYICHEKDFETERPEALMVFYSEKTSSSIFLEDYIIRVVDSLYQTGLKILDRGEIKIDGVIFKWVLYSNKEPELTVLSFYGVDDYNILYQIQYATVPNKFGKHRKVFEEVKGTFNFSSFGM